MRSIFGVLAVLAFALPQVAAEGSSFSSSSDACEAFPVGAVPLPTCVASVSHEGVVGAVALCPLVPIDVVNIHLSLLSCEIPIRIASAATGDPNPFDDDRRLSAVVRYTITNNVAPAADPALALSEALCNDAAAAGDLACSFDGVAPIFFEFATDGCMPFEIVSRIASRGLVVETSDRYQLCLGAGNAFATIAAA